MNSTIVAVVGDASVDDAKKKDIAFEVGRLLVDQEFILATGGMGGVMKYASQGAKTSKKYKKNSIIGVLPGYSTESANPYVDISLATGMGIARNYVLVSMSHAVIAIGGGSGTLNEISTAWQMGKLIIAMNVDGWSGSLAGKKLDSKRNDVIYAAENAENALSILISKLDNYRNNFFAGIKPTRMSNEEASKIVKHSKLLDSKKTLHFLGKGNEGFVFTDGDNVCKLIDIFEKPLELYWSLLSLSERLRSISHINAIPKFDVFLQKNKIFIIYKYEKTTEIRGDKTLENKRLIFLLRDFLRLGWILTDFSPKNIRIKENGDLVVVDIGKSFMPISNYMFESMSRRAFVTYKLNGVVQSSLDLRKYLSSVNEHADFSLMREIGFSEIDLMAEYQQFLNQATSLDKKDVLNPVIKKIFEEHISAETVFDYGSGHGDMSIMLKGLGLRITSYDPDDAVLLKYKNNYISEAISKKSDVKRLIEAKKKFDCVLCSLVLCHKLEKNEKKRLIEIDKIMREVSLLSNKYAVIAICNPLYTVQKRSLMQARIVHEKFNYQESTEYEKEIFSSNKKRPDIHRPISFYENLFFKNDFRIKKIIQTTDYAQSVAVFNSDFIIFLLEKS